MKKLLFLIFIFVNTIFFAQQNDDNTTIKQNSSTNTLSSISASPNPFNVNTQISFYSSKNQTIEFAVKNLLGKTVFRKKILSKTGTNFFNFGRNDITKGMYIYTLQTDVEVISKRLVIR